MLEEYKVDKLRMGAPVEFEVIRVLIPNINNPELSSDLRSRIELVEEQL
jgi:hypothetical protein